ncbi:hypothetical protein JTE90_011268 [Oedothorax gibbosus]|uniref:Uncharacterized protein n=1 Tax=Oedothorax gibbosus TaxID=931172 RepID=A0AAV6TK99_9ARAC|nr:hypothetical protein JTE90_011268 [Oedothorax gibbosus]
MFNCCSHGTLLQLQSSRLSLEYLLLPPRSAPVAAPGGLTPGTFNARHRDPPTHCGVTLHEGSSAVAARYRPNAGASSIFRASCFGRSIPEGKFGGNQLLDGSISLTPLDPDLTIDLHVRTATDPTRVSSGLVLSGIVHIFRGSQRVRSNSRHFHKWNAAGLGAPARRSGTGIPNAADLRRAVLSFRRRVIQDPLTRAHVRLLGPCFKTGRVEFTTRLRLGLPSNPDSKEIAIRIEPSSYGPRTTWATAPVKGELLQSRLRHAPLLNATFPTPLRAGDSALASPRFTPVSKETLLVSFPPLLYA